MKRWIRIWRQGLRDESGIEVVEYAIITGLIVAAAVVSLGILGIWVSGQFSSISENVDAGPVASP